MSSKPAFTLTPQEVPFVETSERIIRTKLPVPESLPILETLQKYENITIGDELPIIWDRAYGHSIEDNWGNKWIDFTSTIFVTNSGHGHPTLIKGLNEVVNKPLTHAYNYPTNERAEYLQKVADFTPSYLEKFTLLTTGSEAVERAIKLARIYGKKQSPDKHIIVGSDGNFHGKTMGSQMAGGKHDNKKWIGYLDPNMHHMPFPYFWEEDMQKMSGAELFHKHIKSLEEKGIDLKNVAAFLLESFQGWGAVFYPVDYIQAMRKWSKDNNVLLMFDEIQAGFGRTGKLFTYEHYEVEPDIVICGKAASAGTPLSVVMGRADVIDLDGEFPSTHGGHPMACVSGTKTIEIFEQENLVAESKRKEKYFLETNKRLKERFPNIVDKTIGKGCLFAVYIKSENPDPNKSYRENLDYELTNKIVEKAMHKGVFLIKTGCGTLKFGPPLTITDSALKEALEVIEESVIECIENR